MKNALKRLANFQIGGGPPKPSIGGLSALKISLPSIKGREVLSLTIEHGLIKLLVTRGLEVIDHRVNLASPQFFREGLVGEQSRVAGVIKSALHDIGPRRRKVIGAVPGFQNNLRLLYLPKARGLDPAAVIPREARRAMGFSLETTQVVWHKMPDEGERTRWLVASAARHSVESLTQTAQQAGLRMSTVDLRPFALARVVNRPDALFAWVAPDGSDVVIIKDSVPVQQQALFWGAGTVEGTVLAERVSEMVERTAALYNDNHPGAAIDDTVPVFVSGSPIAIEPEIGDQVAANLRRPAGVLAPPLSLPQDFPIHDLVINVGLALRET